VVFTDAEVGHVVGDGGTLLTTTDGGQTWAWRGDRRFGFLRDLSFPDAVSGRAVGTLGSPLYTALATADGGATWSVQAGSFGPDLAWSNLDAVWFSDPLHGHVAGDSGRIFATADGGQHWSVQRKDTTETFSRLAFADRRRGLAVGATQFTEGPRASFVATADGGETWISRLVQGTLLNDVVFATPSEAYAVGAVCPRAEEACRSLIVKITFPAGSEETAGEAAGLPVPLVVGVIGVGVVLAAVIVRRRRATSH
jgi:photosystem II stability/assembly factor-like uncharacterized protein